MAATRAPQCGKIAHLIGLAWVRLWGWKVEGRVPDAAKCVFVAAPHTSNWDMPHMMGVAWALGLKIAWMGKKQLFRWPAGALFRWLGGIAVDRSGPKSMVRRATELFASSQALYLVVPVEGTRSHAPHWKSGFYHIAREAKVPIVCSYLDYADGVTGIGLVLEPSGDIAADMGRIRDFYAPHKGKFPEMQGPVRLREEDLLCEDQPRGDAAVASAVAAQ